uniref:ANIS5_cation-bd domain-containing protein n=1 Tax=Haemonchus contortus TaxID=6289 RepID=A0A7I4YGK7_HAECO
MKLLISFCLFAVTAAHLSYYFMEMFHPPFLNDKDVSWEAQHVYYKILFNKTLTITEQKKELRAWAKENNLTKEVTSFFSQIGKGVVEMNKNVSKLIDTLPVAFRNLTKILKNEDQTMSQMMNAIEKLKAEQPSVFSVLDTAMEQVMGNNGPSGPHLKPQGGPSSSGEPNLPSWHKGSNNRPSGGSFHESKRSKRGMLLVDPDEDDESYY